MMDKYKEKYMDPSNAWILKNFLILIIVNIKKLLSDWFF